MTDLFVLLLSGAAVGIILGLVGGGGSIIAVPLLLYGVGMQSVHAAIGTSAVAVALNAFANLMVKARQGLVKWPCAIVFTISGIVGSTLGTRLALMVDGSKLLSLFGGLMLIVGTLMLVRKDAEGDPNVRLSLITMSPMALWLIGIGFGVGVLAGFFGIGGGFLVVPGLMLATGMPITHAIATSLVAIAGFGAVTAFHYAWEGVVDWWIAGWFLGGGIFGSIIGQLIGQRLMNHKAMLQSVFAVFILAIGSFVLFKGLP